MLDLPRLQRIRLSPAPLGQRVVAYTLLVPNYELPPRVRIDLEGAERLPDEPVIYAMNHTDRFNYWPLQYALWRRRGRFTATWVKGKYYENRFVGRFMELMNNIPTVSRGYLITRDFISTMGRHPTDAEYEAARLLVDAAARHEEREPGTTLPRELLTRRRDMLGRLFVPARESYACALDALFRRMMRRFVELNEDACRMGLDLLVFPQGTRSVRLSRGHTGLAQMAMHLARPVVPVGCSGSDRVYPGSSPIARGGHVVYRFGDAIAPGKGAAWVRAGQFEPFTPEAETKYAGELQRYVDDVMERIDGLVDPEYRFADDRESEGVEGSRRFV